MSGFVSLVLLVPRYMLITGLTVLALVFFSDDLNAMGAGVDFELVLPFAMREFIPTGLLGLLIAALLAAFMSTYAATVNAAPAYIVNDIYKRYIRPDAPQKTYVRMSYVASVAVVLIGTGLGFFVPNLNSLVLWIVGALYGGYAAANLLKWYWWRFNSYGYFWGMVSGMLAAGFVPMLMDVMFGPGVRARHGQRGRRHRLANGPDRHRHLPGPGRFWDICALRNCRGGDLDFPETQLVRRHPRFSGVIAVDTTY